MIKKTKWSTNGKKYSKTGAVDGAIEYDELQESSTASLGGTPIDGPLAASLIHRLLKMIPPKILFRDPNENLVEKFKSSFNKLNSAQSTNNADPKMLEEFQKDYVESQEGYNEVVDLLAGIDSILELLRNSLAITIDKDLILQTLSQPGCEGIRFYQCLSETKNSEPEGQARTKLSFVTVGVNSDREDLGFSFDATFNEQFEKIKNASFCSEYGSSSGTINLGDIKSEELKPFVLLRYALNPILNKDGKP